MQLKIKKKVTGGGREKRFDSESPSPEFYVEKPIAAGGWQRGRNRSVFTSSQNVSLLFNTLSRFIRALLPRSKCLSISWLQSPSSVILESKKMTSVTVSTFHPSICHEVMGPDAKIVFEC